MARPPTQAGPVPEPRRVIYHITGIGQSSPMPMRTCQYGHVNADPQFCFSFLSFFFFFLVFLSLLPQQRLRKPWNCNPDQIHNICRFCLLPSSSMAAALLRTPSSSSYYSPSPSCKSGPLSEVLNSPQRRLDTQKSFIAVDSDDADSIISPSSTPLLSTEKRNHA